MFLRRAEKGMQSMAREDNLYELPEGLPIPVDDGASDHLPGTRLPSVPLRSTAGNVVDLRGTEGGPSCTATRAWVGPIKKCRRIGTRSRVLGGARRSHAPLGTTMRNFEA